MSILLDTHAIHWLGMGDPRLSSGAKTAIRSNPGKLFVSAISALELSRHAVLGRIEFPEEVGDWWEEVLNHHGVQEVAVDGRIASDAPTMTLPHKDPFDRIIVATARRHALTLVTCDGQIRRSLVVPCVW